MGRLFVRGQTNPNYGFTTSRRFCLIFYNWRIYFNVTITKSPVVKKKRGKINIFLFLSYNDIYHQRNGTSFLKQVKPPRFLFFELISGGI